MAAREGDTYTGPRGPRQSCTATCTTRSCHHRRRKPLGQGLLLGTAHPESSWQHPGSRGVRGQHPAPRLSPSSAGCSPRPGDAASVPPSSQPRREPPSPALRAPGFSPQPRAGPGPPGLTMEVSARRSDASGPASCLHVCLRIALWVPSSSRQGFDVTLMHRLVGRARVYIFISSRAGMHATTGSGVHRISGSRFPGLTPRYPAVIQAASVSSEGRET